MAPMYVRLPAAVDNTGTGERRIAEAATGCQRPPPSCPPRPWTSRRSVTAQGALWRRLGRAAAWWRLAHRPETTTGFSVGGERSAPTFRCWGMDSSLEPERIRRRGCGHVGNRSGLPRAVVQGGVGSAPCQSRSSWRVGCMRAVHAAVMSTARRRRFDSRECRVVCVRERACIQGHSMLCP